MGDFCIIPFGTPMFIPSGRRLDGVHEDGVPLFW